MAELNQSGSFTGTGVTEGFRPNRGFFTCSFGGGTGTVKIERSRDGSLWYDVSKDQDGNAASYALTGEEMSFDLSQADSEMLWRLNCTAYTSGTITWGFTQ